ncbi:MAG: phosphoenolpyruvate carboxylase, partial [Pseudomonadota bacterium]
MAGMDTRSKDEPLREDIRRLGRLVGETVAAQEGEDLLGLVEEIRLTALRFHRDGDRNARRELEDMTTALQPERAIVVIRAFSYFSHLANIAEDLHHVRRTREHEIAGSAPRPGTTEHALDVIADAGRGALEELLASAHVRPVLTAHPTEVRRKSTMRREMAIAELLDQRSRHTWTPEELRDIDDGLARAVLILWQTNLLRQSRLSVLDEVANGLTFFRYTFFRELPRLLGEIEDRISERLDAPNFTLPTFMGIGSWIGGDRDGNPNVTAETLRNALRRQSIAVLRHYLHELDKLGDELSLSIRLIDVTPELKALADASPDSSPHRTLEPYRRALTGMYARLAATLRALHDMKALRKPVGKAPPYATPEELTADLLILDASLRTHGAAALCRGRLRRLTRAVACFGFHLATIDLRQNSDIHEATLADLYRAIDPDDDYSSLSEDDRIDRLARELDEPRPLRGPFTRYDEQTERELAILEAARIGRETYGDAAVTTSIISNTRLASDLLGLAVLLKETG